MRLNRPGSESASIVAMAAAVQIGFPLYVPACIARPSISTSKSSSRPPTAAIEKPPAIALAKTDRSGSSPKYSRAPPRARRKPVITSSKTDTAPCSRHSSISPCRYPSSGMHEPELTLTGSVITQPICSEFSAKARSRAARSFHGSAMTSAYSLAG